MKKIVMVVKRLIFSIIVLYCTNLIIYSCNVIIPINYVSILTLSFLGIPGLLSLLLIYFII